MQKASQNCLHLRAPDRPVKEQLRQVAKNKRKPKMDKIETRARSSSLPNWLNPEQSGSGKLVPAYAGRAP